MITRLIWTIHTSKSAALEKTVSLNHSFNHSITQSLPHSLTHSLTHSQWARIHHFYINVQKNAVHWHISQDIVSRWCCHSVMRAKYTTSDVFSDAVCICVFFVLTKQAAHRTHTNLAGFNFNQNTFVVRKSYPIYSDFCPGCDMTSNQKTNL